MQIVLVSKDCVDCKFFIFITRAGLVIYSIKTGFICKILHRVSIYISENCIFMI